jgi:sulfite reductase alpha subunit-like flavoprotein
MHYTVFGLGDTAYEKYNEIGKYFDNVFTELGATRVYPLGLGNSQFQQTEE